MSVTFNNSVYSGNDAAEGLYVGALPPILPNPTFTGLSLLGTLGGTITINGTVSTVGIRCR
jgi:hypothetical protein